MAAFGWKRWWWVVAVVLLPSAPEADCRNVTHEDIRDAMLSLVHMFRSSEDKLERHEYREKGLGDQLKKMLSGLEKRHRALEPLKGMISRLDERLSNVETILLQKEEREKASQKKTDDALETIQKSLGSLINGLPASKSSVVDNLTTNDDTVSKRLDVTDSKLDAVKQEVESLKNSMGQEALRAMCLSLGPDANPLEKHISEAEKLLNKYEVKLNEYNLNATKVQTDIVPLSEVSLADEAWHSKMTDVMERQEKEVQKIQRLLSDAEGLWKELPRRADLQDAANGTLAAVQALQETMNENKDKSESKVIAKVRELGDRLSAANGDIQRILTQGNTDSERAYNHITKSYDSLRTEVQSLSRVENVLYQTADNVLVTKKRIEYGVHQILAELGELIMTQGKNLNKTIHDRFDGIESKIVEKQATAMTNLSTKIETERSEVSLADEAWHSKMTDVMERQEKEVQKIQRLLSDAEGLWKELPRRADLQDAANGTLAAVQALQETMNENKDKSESKVIAKVRELGDRLSAANGDIQRILTQGNTDSERAYNHITKSYDSLRTEVQSLSRGENVLLQTADNVMATKKRIEYGVHQILVELGELVKTQGNNLNKTIHDRFDGIESTIVEKQATAMTNLSTKIETEMAQVWRQIAVVYQQLTASKDSLDKLTDQTERYVNGSSTTMESMRDKVGQISTRMTEVDENLNYLLGRLSLVTQEFSQVRDGLGAALDRVKSSLNTVQDKLGDAGPGPHKITSAERV